MSSRGFTFRNREKDLSRRAMSALGGGFYIHESLERATATVSLADNRTGLSHHKSFTNSANKWISWSQQPWSGLQYGNSPPLSPYSPYNYGVHTVTITLSTVSVDQCHSVALHKSFCFEKFRFLSSGDRPVYLSIHNHPRVITRHLPVSSKLCRNTCTGSPSFDLPLTPNPSQVPR